MPRCIDCSTEEPRGMVGCPLWFACERCGAAMCHECVAEFCVGGAVLCEGCGALQRVEVRWRRGDA